MSYLHNGVSLKEGVESLIDQVEEDCRSLSNAIEKIEKSDSENTSLMIYRSLHDEGKYISLNGYALFGFVDEISVTGMTSKKEQFVDILLEEGTKFGFVHNSEGFINVYGVSNNTLHVTADFEIFVGKEEIKDKLEQLYVPCEYIREYVDSIGLQNKYF
ncbi:MAG: hypothetical protein KAJ91_00695 [Candidatus Aenigmarchaeota archaeon]|nr:hypothetical protein [Candidatus Aenigmarchaeota archaeon]MCK5333457.1 hypothetical protein [Candidatus Aenigmarchaeota archaeon]